jgi:hypothetical protein
VTPAEVEALVHRLAPDLDAFAAPWALIGSGALILLGVPLELAADLDVVVGVEGAARLRSAWADWREIGEPKAPTGRSGRRILRAIGRRGGRSRSWAG